MSFQIGSFQSPGFQKGTEFGVNAQSVISDILIQEADLTFQDFETLFARTIPFGFEPFERFMVGDLEYRRALVNLRVSGDGISVPSISALKAQIDVPDVFDSGTAVITGSGTLTINFNRSFHIVPEVICAMKSGTTFVTPRVSSISKTQFTVELRDASNNPVAGTITWSAHGY